MALIRFFAIAACMTLVDCPFCFSQQDKVNQTTANGARTGRWITYYSNGNIESEGSYKPFSELTSAERQSVMNSSQKLDTTSDVRVGTWKVYTTDGRPVVVTDYFTGMHDTYEYDRSGRVKYVIRSWNNSKPVFVVGRKDSVMFMDITFEKNAPVDQLLDISTTAVNLSDHAVNVNMIPITQHGVRGDSYRIEPHDTVRITTKFLQPSGAHLNHLVLQSNEWVFGLELNSFGYHLTTEDFIKAIKPVVPHKSYYFKTGDEYLLKVTKGNGKPVKSIPLAPGKVLVHLRRGSYLFTVVSPSYQRRLPVEVKY